MCPYARHVTLQEPEESPNDYNDRAIRVATEWLQRQMGSSAKVGTLRRI